MRLHEHRAKEIFCRHGMPVPPGRHVLTAEQARRAAEELGPPVVLKSQVLVGGRGKAGGVRTAGTAEEAVELAAVLLDLEIKGLRCEGVLVEKKLDVEQELYCGVSIDQSRGVPVLMLSAAGGVDIEEAARSAPERLVRVPLSPLRSPFGFELLPYVKKIGLTGRTLVAVRDAVRGLLGVFRSFFALTAEINPLIVDGQGGVWCADAVLEVDDAALYRHPDLLRLRLDALPERRRRMVGRGATFVPLGGNVGVISSGAGLGMATMDLIRDYAALSPANFLETGGGITEELMADCMEEVLDQPGLEAVLINLYGGINPIHEGARGIACVMRARGVSIPVVAKALGNRQRETWETLEAAGVHTVRESSTRSAVRRLAELLGLEDRS